MTSNKNSSDSISISDAVRWQDSLKKEIDFDKPDTELTPEEVVKKAMYLAMDKEIEKNLGKDIKKDLDDQRTKLEALSKFQINLNKLSELGKEIEKSYIWQTAYLSNHFDKSKENYYFVVTRGLTDEMVNKKGISDSERVELANKVLSVTKTYREKISSELIVKQEVISGLLPTFEKLFNSTDFNLFGSELNNTTDAERIRSQFQEWLGLSKELLQYHQKGIDAVLEDIDLDEILPNHVIESNGDVTKNVSNIEMVTKGKRVIEKINEADKAEKNIAERRLELAKDLFGDPENYMDFKHNTEVEKITKNPLEDKSWFRFAKVIYILGIFLGVLISLGLMSEEFEIGFWFFVGVIVLAYIVKGAFYYIVLGKTDWKK